MATSFTISLWDTNDISWIFGAVGIALTIGRYVIRWKITRKFYLDDIAQLFAVLFMIAALACYTVVVPSIYDFYAFAEGEAPENDPLFDSIELISAIFHILFYCSLWTVKLAFLLFYRQLFRISRPFKISWWVVLGFNGVTFIMSIVGSLLLCDNEPSQLGNWHVCEDLTSATVARQVYTFTFVAVITSDLAVMALPLAMLRGLQMRRVQKCSIGAIFCLSLVSVAFETLRLAKSFIGGDTLNILWINLEMTFAVIVSALPSYYALIGWKKHRAVKASNSSNDAIRRKPTFDASSTYATHRTAPGYTTSTRTSDEEKWDPEQAFFPPDPFLHPHEFAIMQTQEVHVDYNRRRHEEWVRSIASRYELQS